MSKGSCYFKRMGSLWEQHKAERRNRILATARRLITEGGVEALSMRQLARESRLSVATLYNLHGSKADILYALLDQALDSVDASLEHIPAHDPLEFIEYMVDLATVQFIDDKTFYRPLMSALNTSYDLERDPLIGRRALMDIERALRAAADEGMFIGYTEATWIARQFYLNLLQAILYWSLRLIDDDELRLQCRYSIVVCILGVAADRVRPVLLDQLRILSTELSGVYPSATVAIAEIAKASAR